jgi:hypothetical protein
MKRLLSLRNLVQTAVVLVLPVTCARDAVGPVSQGGGMLS